MDLHKLGFYMLRCELAEMFVHDLRLHMPVHHRVKRWRAKRLLEIETRPYLAWPVLAVEVAHEALAFGLVEEFLI